MMEEEPQNDGERNLSIGIKRSQKQMEKNWGNKMRKISDTLKLENGYEILCVGFSTWQTPDRETAVNAVSEAIRAGYRHIDTAACYGNEVSVGKGIKAIGVSNFLPHHLDALMNTEVKPMVNQIEFHPGQMQDETE